MVAKNKTSVKAKLQKSKEFMKQCVQHIAKKIIAARSSDGQTPHGLARKLLKQGQKCFPNMNMNQINYAVKKISDDGPGENEKVLV
jgi:hypothetical protein